MDYKKGHSKGFAFIEFEEAEDASEAIFNRNGASLMGRTLQVSMAQANQANKLSEPVWNNDEWYQQNNEKSGDGEGAATTKDGGDDKQQQ